MVNAGSVPACGALSFLHLLSDRRIAPGQIAVDRKPFWAVLTQMRDCPFAFAAGPKFRRTGHDMLFDKAPQHFFVIRNDSKVLRPEKRTFVLVVPDDPPARVELGGRNERFRDFLRFASRRQAESVQQLLRAALTNRIPADRESHLRIASLNSPSDGRLRSQGLARPHDVPAPNMRPTPA